MSKITNIKSEIFSNYTPVIGLEIHCQLNTNSKMFSPEANTYGELPNTVVSHITIAHPGTMPCVNKKAIDFALKMGIACNCNINKKNYFARKNYFYPDLPKGYQITQHENPICSNGYITINPDSDKEKKISLTRIHIEEDTGKSIHGIIDNTTLLDFNRAGTPLIEIVTEPVIANSNEAYVLLYEIRKLLRYLEICDGNMEEGSLRCDANVSVMKNNAKKFGTKVEVKNMNSIRNVQLAIEHEIKRQIIEIENGNTVQSETRNFDPETNSTVRQRLKEDSSDYRYFIEPDISPVIISNDWLNNIKNDMPTLPREYYNKLKNEYKLPEYDCKLITEDKHIVLFYQKICDYTKNYKAASNWIMGPIKSYLNEYKTSIENFPISYKQIAQIINIIDEGKINFSLANRLFNALLKTPQKNPLELALSLNMIQESNENTIEQWIDEVIAENPEKVILYQNGKKGLFGMFMGELMKKSKGKADPKKTSAILKNKLK